MVRPARIVKAPAAVFAVMPTTRSAPQVAIGLRAHQQPDKNNACLSCDKIQKIHCGMKTMNLACVGKCEKSAKGW